MLHCQCRNFGRSYFQGTQIPFRHRYLCGIHGLNDQLTKGILRCRKGSGSQESSEFSEHRFQKKIARPHAQISMIGHVVGTFGIIPGSRGTSELDRKRRANLSRQWHSWHGNLGFQLPVLALFARAGGSAGGVKLWAISRSRSRRDSPTPANTWEQASRSLSSAAVAIPEIISRDW